MWVLCRNIFTTVYYMGSGCFGLILLCLALGLVCSEIVNHVEL